MKRFLSFIFLVIIVTSLSGQSEVGTLEGRVVDARDGNPLWNANIVVVGASKGAATDADGYYTVLEMQPGTYEIRFSMIGYRTVVKNRVVIKPGKPTMLDIELNEEIGTEEAIKVKPTYFEEVEDHPVSTRNMDYEEIAAQPGGNFDISRSISAMPSVVSSADTDNEIIVRGGNYGENLFMMDNIEIPNPNHFGHQGTSGGAISAVYTDFVEDATFYAGAFPAQYGEKASSVLDIDLREGLRDGLHFKVDVGMSGVGGNVEGPYADGQGSYMLAFHRSFLDLINSAWNMTAVPQYWNLQGKAVYDLDPKNKLSYFGMYAKDWIYFDVGEEGWDDADFIINSRSHQYNMGLNYRHVMKKGFNTLTLSSTQNHWFNEWIDSNGVDHEFHNYSTEYNHTIKNSITLLPTKKDEIGAGLYLKYSHFDYDYYDDYDTLYIYEPGTDSIIGTTDYTYGLDTVSSAGVLRYGGYAQYKRNWGARIVSNIGLRLDGMDWKGSVYLSPRASLTYRLTSETDLSLAYGRHYQSPELFELAFDEGSKNLDYYYTDQAVLGLSHLFREDVMGSIELYYKQYRDIPIEKSVLTEDPYDNSFEWVNGLKGYAQGVEFFLQKKVRDNLWGTISYSFSQARNIDPRQDTDSTEYGEFPKGFDYGHVFNGIIGYQMQFKDKDWYQEISKKGWWKAISWIPGMPSDESEYSVRYRYLGGRPYSEPTYHPEFRTWAVDPGDPYNQDRMPYYATLDLRVQSRWYFGKWTLFTYFEVDNALNRKNIWEYQRYSDGGVDKIYQRSLMPVGGIIIEF